MADVINLKAWKKAADRAAKRAAGDENAARFGRSKALKKLEEAKAERARLALDGHRRTGQGPSSEADPESE